MATVLKINQADNVAVAVANVAAGDICHVDGRQIKAVSDIPAGHKMALRNLQKGENVIKYGYPIGIWKASWTTSISRFRSMSKNL